MYIVDDDDCANYSNAFGGAGDVGLTVEMWSRWWR